MSKHTPGPWAVDDDGDVCTDDLERIVAAVDWRHVSLRDGEAAANARLIAAAPDLLAACEAVDSWCLSGRMWSHEARAAREALRAAVAKARGEP